MCLHRGYAKKSTPNNHDVGLYLIDITLPDGDGLEVARTLRLRSDRGIVLITGRGDEIDTVLGPGAWRRRLHREAVSGCGKLRARGEIRRAPAASCDGGTKPTMPRVRKPAKYVVQGIGINPDFFPRACPLGGGKAADPHHARVRPTARADVAAQPCPVRATDHGQGAGGRTGRPMDRTVDGLVSRLRNKLFNDGTGHEKIKTIRGIGLHVLRRRAQDQPALTSGRIRPVIPRGLRRPMATIKR